MGCATGTFSICLQIEPSLILFSSNKGSGLNICGKCRIHRFCPLRSNELLFCFGWVLALGAFCSVPFAVFLLLYAFCFGCFYFTCLLL